jgi:hypothetical protein
MPGDGPADGNKMARFAIDLPGFLRWLSAAREGPSCLSDPESPKVDKSLIVGLSAILFSDNLGTKLRYSRAERFMLSRRYS